MENDGDATTLRHWVEELNTFQEKWSLFRDKVVADIENNQDSSEPEFEVDADHSPTAAISSALSIPSMMSLPQCAIELSKVNWEGGDGGWEAMLSLKDALVTHDKSYHAASEALMTLSSKSTLESAASSVEKTRDLLYDTASDQSSTVYDQSEKAHDLLNEVEATIQRCAEQVRTRMRVCGGRSEVANEERYGERGAMWRTKTLAETVSLSIRSAPRIHHLHHYLHTARYTR